MKWLRYKPLLITIAVLSAVVLVALLLRYALKKWNMGDLSNPNIQAFLKTIRYAEGTAHANGYRTVYGGSLVNDLSDHPAVTGEWTGKTLPDAYCKGAGLSPGCKSTAAGAYQFIKPTWNRLKLMLNLPDFSPESQDLAALQLIREHGALQLIKDGKFQDAISKVNDVWASLPGFNEGQPEVSFITLRSIYIQNGGTLA